MKHKSPVEVCLLAVVLLSQFALGARANGFRLPDQDAEATARGEAFAATADNPSAIYYNPAGITQLEGHNVRAGVYGLSFNTEFGSPAGGSFDTKRELHLMPQLFYTYTPEKFPLSFGLGVYAPFGMSVEWPQDTGFRTKGLQSDMTYLTVNPVVAWKIRTNLSIAIGPTFNFSDIDLQQGVTPFPNNDLFKFKADNAVAYGFNAGVMWKPLEQVSLGATYRSSTKLNYSGYTETSFVTLPPSPPFPPYPPYMKLDASAELPIPQSIALGISYRPTPKWNLEFNADWTDWNQLNTVAINQALPVPPLVLNWQSSWYYEFGVTRDLGKGWHASAGYIYNENSVPDATYNPLVPDQNRQFVSVGVGYKGRHFSFDVAYQYGFSDTRTVTGSMPSPVGQTADGNYDYTSNAFAVSAGWRF
jgi:long-chain fatty acid transport protein